MLLIIVSIVVSFNVQAQTCAIITEISPVAPLTHSGIRPIVTTRAIPFEARTRVLAMKHIDIIKVIRFADKPTHLATEHTGTVMETLRGVGQIRFGIKRVGNLS